MINVFLVYTPLQENFANSIIKNRGLQKFLIINVYQEPKLKNLYLLLALCLKSENVILYTANIKKIYSRVVYNFLRPSDLYTYDDGIGHMIDTGYFFSNDKCPKSFFLKALGFKSYIPFLKSKLSGHFTFTDCTHVQEFFDKPVIKLKKLNCQISNVLSVDDFAGKVIILGSPFVEDRILNVSQYLIFLTEIFEKYDFNIIYYAHPREKRLEELKAFFSNHRNLLFASNLGAVEEVLPNNVRKVIGFYSTALVFLKELGFDVSYFSNQALRFALGDMHVKLERALINNNVFSE